MMSHPAYLIKNTGFSVSYNSVTSSKDDEGNINLFIMRRDTNPQLAREYRLNYLGKPDLCKVSSRRFWYL